MQYPYQDYVGLIQKSLVEHWDMPALTDYKGITLQYKDVARKIEKLHLLFEAAGLQPKDKVAICGRNSAHWAVAFLASMTYGATVVPILHEFKAEQVHNIVNHSDARLLFVGDVVWPLLNPEEMPNIEGVLHLPDFQLNYSRSEQLTAARETLNARFGERYPKYFRREHVAYRPTPDGDALAIINYTSGTTSNSKGVLIPYRALWSNYDFALQVLGEQVKEGQRIISMLPMAHMYGMAFEFLFEFLHGVHVHYLTRQPSPSIIVQAFAEVKPCVVISVPLIIEKIIKKRVLPKLETPSMKLLLRVPVLSEKIMTKVREQICNVFGGEFYEIIIGGAAINKEVEYFLKRMSFPYTVGYGATECAPIITYADWQHFVQGSCGRAAPRMEIKIASRDPHNEVGEILVRGANVMLGYYKNPEATAAALDADGWYHTGDLGVIDHEGNLFIRGRSKNMLLGSNGQNIYPEEIEDKLNTLPYVMESIVIQKGDRLYALIHPDYEEVERDGLDENALARQMEENRRALNQQINAYEQIAKVRICPEEFEKTPKRSIKRFLYENAEV